MSGEYDNFVFFSCFIHSTFGAGIDGPESRFRFPPCRTIVAATSQVLHEYCLPPITASHRLKYHP